MTEYNPLVIDYIKRRISEREDANEKRFVSYPRNEKMSALDMLEEIENKTELGLKFYKAAERIYFRESH